MVLGWGGVGGWGIGGFGVWRFGYLGVLDLGPLARLRNSSEGGPEIISKWDYD